VPLTATGRSRLVVAHVCVAFVLSALVAVLYLTTFLQIRRLQPGYPQRIIMSVFTPPEPFRLAHGLGPPVFLAGTIVIGVLARRAARREPPAPGWQAALIALHAAFLLPFLLVFLWASLWCHNVFAAIERSRA
jgi:hypothetical protein